MVSAVFPLCLPPPCQLQPCTAGCCSTPMEGKIRTEGIWGATSHCSWCQGWGPCDNSSHWCWQVWEVIGTITQVQAWAPGMAEGTWEPRRLQLGWSLWPPTISCIQCASNFLGCIRSLGLDSSHPLLESTCTHLGHYHSYLMSTRKGNTCCCCSSMEWRGCWCHSACHVCREWVLLCWYWRETAQLFPQHHFWSGPWTKPATTANRCLCHQASRNMEYCVAEWYI